MGCFEVLERLTASFCVSLQSSVHDEEVAISGRGDLVGRLFQPSPSGIVWISNHLTLGGFAPSDFA